MRPSEHAYETIKRHEGLRLNAYQDVAGVWTIGYGNTYYPDGKRVKAGDVISLARAVELFKWTVDSFAERILAHITTPLNQNQFDALVSFAYNVGVAAFKNSTLLRKVNANPCDPAIRDQFMRWNKAGGKIVNGLTVRRKQEADLYFSNKIHGVNT